MLRHVFESDVRKQTVTPKVCFLWTFNGFFCLSALSANYLGDNFVYLNWIVELFHYQTKMFIFVLNGSLIGSKSVLFRRTKAEVHTQISNCWVQFSFHYIKYTRYFFSPFSRNISRSETAHLLLRSILVETSPISTYNLSAFRVWNWLFYPGSKWQLKFFCQSPARKILVTSKMKF